MLAASESLVDEAAVEAVAETVGDVLAREMPAELLGNELAADAAAELESAAVDAGETVDSPDTVAADAGAAEVEVAEDAVADLEPDAVTAQAEADAGPEAVTADTGEVEAEVSGVPQLDVTEAETAELGHDGPEVSDDAYDAADLARLDEVDPSPAGEPAAL